MALYIPHGDGNAVVGLGGLWNNPGVEDPWDNRLQGATEFQFALTIKPDQFYMELPSREYNNGLGTTLVGIAGGSTGGRSFELALYIDGGYGAVVWRIWGDSGLSLIELSAHNAIVPNRLNRFVGQWHARDNYMALWNNSVKLPATVTGSIPSINFASNNPLEIGAQSHSDTHATAGEYSEFAIWTRCHDDAAAKAYGSGVSPNYLPNRGRWKYVTLEKFDGPVVLPAPGDIYNTAPIHDEWQGNWPTNRLGYGGLPLYLYLWMSPQALRSPTGVAWYPGNAEGVIREVPHPVVWGGVSAILPDSELLPKRDLECGELDGTSIGKRSGVTKLVPSGFTLFNALGSAGPGDTIIIDASLPQKPANGLPFQGPDISAWPTTAGTPRMPPEHQWYLDAQETLVGTVAPVGTITPDCSGMDHAYVLITSSRDSNLPAPNVKRVIPLPDGEIRRVMHEIGRINESHLTNCATLVIPDDFGAILDLAEGNNARYPQGRLHFRGINFRQNDSQAGHGGVMVYAGIHSGAPYRWNTYDNREMLAPPNHVVFNQCAFTCDPLDTGLSVGLVMEANMLYHGIVNSFLPNWWVPSGGDQKLIGVSRGAAGPWHWENNEIQSPSALWFTGGDGSPFVNVGPDNMTLRRNWFHTPKHWAPSEPNPGRTTGWLVNIHPYSGFRSQADLQVGSPGIWVQNTSPKNGCIMYRPATGRAMYLGTDPVQWASGGRAIEGDPASTVYLSGLWPEGTVSNATVGFQWVSTDPESTPTLYNSGTETIMPRATFTAGSRRVTFDAPIPQIVVDRLAAGDRLYIYPNDTVWAGDLADGGTWVPPAKTNGWSGTQGISRAQARRKRIVSIAPDRSFLDTDSTQNAYPDTITFPYSIVRCDGLYRDSFYHSKGSWENKNGSYWIQEGNIFDHTTNRLYIAGNVVNGAFSNLGRISVSGNIATALDADWHPAIADFAQFRQTYGAPGLFPLLTVGTGGATENPGLSRVLLAITGPRTALLAGPDPFNPDRFMGNGTHADVGWQVNTIAWCHIFAQVMRYNIWERGGGPIVQPEMHIGHAIPGGHVSLHDMLLLRPGDRSWPQSDGPRDYLMLRMAQYNDPNEPHTQAPYVYGPGGGAVYDDPPPTGANGKIRVTNWSIVRPDGSAGPDIFAGGSSGTGSSGYTPAPGKTVDRVTYSENIVDTGPASYTCKPFSPTNDPGALWNPASTRSERNVFAGPGIEQATQRYTQPDNAGVPGSSGIGFAAYANGAIDGYNLENYRLADIYSASTVSIAADYLTVTLDSGTFPSYVAPGQFFRAGTKAMLVKIRAVGSTLGATWNTYAGRGVLVKRAGRAARQKDGLLDAFQTHNTQPPLPGNQWGQVTLATAPFDSPQNTFFDLLIRFTAPNTLSGYRIRCINHEANPTTANLVVLERMDAGVATATGAVVGVSPFVAGDVLLWEMIGTTLSLSRNGTPLATWPGDGTYASGRVGFAIRSLSNQLSNFSCGDYSGAGGSRVALASDAFTGGDATLLLDLAYPESPGSGKPYAVTFKGTATDGRDPGVDIDTLALMVQGVGPVTAPAGVPSAPILTGTPYHTGDTAVSGTGSVGATVALLVNGVAAGAATVSGGGTWTAAVAALVAGQVLTATQTTSGGTSAASSPSTVLASTAPAAPVLTGMPYHPGDTSVTGTGIVGATVTVLVNGSAVGTTTVSGGGTWTRSVTALALGSILTATQTTSGGTSAASSPTTVIDPRPPATVRPIAIVRPVATIRPLTH